MISAGSSLRSGAQTTPENTLLTPLLPGVFSERGFGSSSHPTPPPTTNTDYAWNKEEIDTNINTQHMKPQRTGETLGQGEGRWESRGTCPQTWGPLTDESGGTEA